MKVNYFISKPRTKMKGSSFAANDKESRILQRSRLIHNGGHGAKSGITRHKMFS